MLAERRVLHAAQGEAEDRCDVLADLPAHLIGVVATGVGEIDVLAEDVTERLVDGSGLGVVVQRGPVLGDAMHKLVGDDVLGDHALAVMHLGAIPERVLVVGVLCAFGTEAHRGEQLHALAVDGVAAEEPEEEVVGVSGELMRDVDVIYRTGGIGLAPLASGNVERCRARRASACLGRVAGEAIERAIDGVEAESDVAGGGADEDELADVGARGRGDLDLPDKPCLRDAGSVEDAGIVDPLLGSAGGEFGSAHLRLA